MEDIVFLYHRITKKTKENSSPIETRNVNGALSSKGRHGSQDASEIY